MPHDLVIRNGSVVDGTGEPARRADVAVDGDRIVAVGDVGQVKVLEVDVPRKRISLTRKFDA